MLYSNSKGMSRVLQQLVLCSASWGCFCLVGWITQCTTHKYGTSCRTHLNLQLLDAGATPFCTPASLLHSLHYVKCAALT